MSEFTSPLDIMNRVAQHLGVRRLTAYTDDSKEAQEIVFAYDKLRVAELKRNVWKFATRNAVIRPIDTTTRLIVPNAWDSTFVYRPGSVVTSGGQAYVATLKPGNLGQSPGLGTGGYWEVYFGPLTAQPWADPSTTTFGGYYPGEVVYVNNGLGNIPVFASAVQANTVNPSVVDIYDATVTYNAGDVVSFTDANGVLFYYVSLTDLNLANEPDLSAGLWNANTTYASGATVCGSDGMLYSSTENSNIGNDPTLSVTTFAAGGAWQPEGQAVPWATSFSGNLVPNEWRVIPATLKACISTWPIGTGPQSQSFTKNVYRLPAGFLRRAPQDPAAGAISFLGAASGIPVKDWSFAGNYLITLDVDPIPLRFVANMQDVENFDPLFCEGLAARIGFELAETITQSAQKKSAIGAVYNRFMSEARLINGIETGSDEPPEETLITVRI